MGIIGFRTAVGLAAMAALAACGGSSDNGSGGGSPTDELGFNTPDLVGSGAGTQFIANLEEFVDVLETGLNASTSLNVPNTGTADFAGSSILVDVTIPDDVDTVEEAREYLLLTGDATAAVDLGAGSVNVSMSNFVDIDDNGVSGSIDMPSGSFVPGVATFTGAADGTVGGTVISGNLNGIIFGTATDAQGAYGALSGDGAEAGGIVGSGGPYDGVEIGGAFAAD